MSLIPASNGDGVLTTDEARNFKAKLAKLSKTPGDVETGHGGELVARSSALLWLQTLYDYDFTSMVAQFVKELPEINVGKIAVEVAKRITPYNAAYEDKR
ncbi:MAG: hypothetical protein AB8D78_02435 [Akkermansiaceae bacterium]